MKDLCIHNEQLNMFLHNPARRTARFIQGRGMGTSTLEANLAQQLAGMCNETPLQFFLDVRKAYEYMDR